MSRQTHKLRQPKVRSGFMREQEADDLWNRELNEAHHALESLRPPFLFKVTAGAGVFPFFPVWVFPSDPVFQEAKEDNPFADLSSKEYCHNLKEITQHLQRFKNKEQLRKEIWILLRRFDSRSRQTVIWLDRLIKAYRKVIKQEISKEGALLKAIDTTRLFPLPVTLSKALLSHARKTSDEIHEASILIDRARRQLQPAADFFLGGKSVSRSAAKHRLMRLLTSKGGMRPNPAATLAASLLNLIEPLRRVKQGAMRQLVYSQSKESPS